MGLWDKLKKDTTGKTWIGDSQSKTEYLKNGPDPNRKSKTIATKTVNKKGEEKIWVRPDVEKYKK